jgi:hypothetical protein
MIRRWQDILVKMAAGACSGRASKTEKDWSFEASPPGGCAHTSDRCRRPRNGTKDFSVRATFNSTVTDNQQLQFTVGSATAGVADSTFAAAAAGAAVSSTSGDAKALTLAGINFCDSGVVNGLSGDRNGRAGDANGRAGGANGPFGDANGRAGDANGTSGDANGGAGVANGTSGDANGRAGDANGTSGDANGRAGDANGPSGDANGRAGDANGTFGDANGGAGDANGTFVFTPFSKKSAILAKKRDFSGFESSHPDVRC